LGFKISRSYKEIEADRRAHLRFASSLALATDARQADRTMTDVPPRKELDPRAVLCAAGGSGDDFAGILRLYFWIYRSILGPRVDERTWKVDKTQYWERITTWSNISATDFRKEVIKDYRAASRAVPRSRRLLDAIAKAERAPGGTQNGPTSD